MSVYQIIITYDDEAAVWIAESAEVPGLVLESESLDMLIARVRDASPELLELNCGYTGDIHLSYVIIHPRHSANKILQKAGINYKF